VDEGNGIQYVELPTSVSTSKSRKESGERGNEKIQMEGGEGLLPGFVGAERRAPRGEGMGKDNKLKKKT